MEKKRNDCFFLNRIALYKYVMLCCSDKLIRIEQIKLTLYKSLLAAITHRNLKMVAGNQRLSIKAYAPVVYLLS